MRYVTPIALTLLASPISAACPTIADLEGGIQGRLSTGETDLFKRLSVDVVEEVFSDTEGGQYRSLLGKGVYLLETLDLVDGKPDPETRSVFTFPVSPADLPEPEAGSTYNVTVATRYPGQSWEKETQSYVFGSEVQATYGQCSYRMIPIINRFSGPDEAAETLHYLPELGFAYLAQYAFTEEGQRQVDDYTYVSFEAVR